MRAATANMNNDQIDDTEKIESEESKEATEKKQTKYTDQLFVHYTHEKCLRVFKRDMHQVYENIFKNTPAMDLKLIVGNRNRRDTKKELLHQRPKPIIITRQTNKKTNT